MNKGRFYRIKIENNMVRITTNIIDGENYDIVLSDRAVFRINEDESKFHFEMIDKEIIENADFDFGIKD